MLQALQQCSLSEGRSVSNLASYLLESCLEAGLSPRLVPRLRHGQPQRHGSEGLDPSRRGWIAMAQAQAEEAVRDLRSRPDA